ncbi:MAG: hypothetical protein WB443_02120 [Nitrososphaeraceae archaeon]
MHGSKICQIVGYYLFYICIDYFARLSSKSTAEILGPVVASASSKDNDLSLLERGINLAGGGFNTVKFCELILMDGNRLSEEAASTICERVIAMKMEVNPRLNYEKSTIQFLSELSKIIGLQSSLFT